MKTLTTSRGFEYDLEIVEISQGNSLEVLATCENGSKSFYYDFKLPSGTINDDNSYYFLNEIDLSELENWVDETESSWVVSEIQKICVQQGDLSFTVNAFGKFMVSVAKWNDNRDSVISACHMITLDQMNDYINENKNK